MGKKIFKIIAFGMLAVFAVVGAGVGIYTLFVGLGEKEVPLTSLFINDQSIISSGNIINAGERLGSNGNIKYLIIEDDITFTFEILPEDATNKGIDVRISSSSSMVPITCESKAYTNSPFKIKTVKDENGRNVGGSATIDFGTYFKIFVIVDVPTLSNDIKYDLNHLASVTSGATTEESGGKDLYVVARKDDSITINLEAPKLHNPFKINGSGLNYPTEFNFVDREVLFFTDQNDVIEAKPTGINKTPGYELSINLNNISDTHLTVFTRMHRTYQMQQDFKAGGFDVFFDYHYGKPIDTAGYTELITNYSAFINKYYSYINDTREITEFFARFKQPNNQISLNTEPELFKQVWKSLEYVFVAHDLEFLISDIEISGLKVKNQTPMQLEPLTSTTFSVTELREAFGIETTKGEGSNQVTDDAAMLAILNNLNLGVFIYDENSSHDGMTTHQYLENIYNLNNVINANPQEDYGITPEVEGAMRLNNAFLEVERSGNNYIFKTKIPSEIGDGFRIYIMFALSITNASGETKVFYNFGEVFINKPSMSFIGGKAHNIVSELFDMYIDNNDLIKAHNILGSDYKIGNQQIIIDTNKITNAQDIQKQYLVPRLFVEQTSNTIERAEEINVYVGDRVETIAKQGFNVIKTNGKISNFTTLLGELLQFNSAALAAYEIPLIDIGGGRYEGNLTAINASLDKVRFFVAFVLADENYNPIDREGNRLFNDAGDAISPDGELLEVAPTYVIIDSTYSSELTERAFYVSSILEQLSYYTKINMGETDQKLHSYLYEEKDSQTGNMVLKSISTGEWFLRNNRRDGSIEEKYTKLKMLNETEFNDLIVSAYRLVQRSDSKIFIQLTEKEFNQIQNGIDVIGNIKIAFDIAFNDMGNQDKLSFTTGTENGAKVEVYQNEQFSDNVSIMSSQDATINLTLDATNLKAGEHTECVLQINNTTNIYGLISGETMKIIVNSPLVFDIEEINDEQITDIKNVVMSGKFDRDGKYGEVEWSFYTTNSSGERRFSLYYGGGKYKTHFKINAKDTNMQELFIAYLEDIKTAKEAIEFDESLLMGKNQYNDLPDIISIVNKEIDKYNNEHGTNHAKITVYYNENLNVVDIANNSNNFISNYLANFLFAKHDMEFSDYEQNNEKTYNANAIIQTLKNYGVALSTKNTNESDLDYITRELIRVLEAGGEFSDYKSGVLALFNAYDLESAIIDEASIARVINYIEYRSPKYKNILDLSLRVDSIWTFDFNQIKNAIEEIAGSMGDFVDLSGDYYSSLTAIYDYINTHHLSFKATTLQDVALFINTQYDDEIIKITNDANVASYFLEDTYNVTSHVLTLNEDGTLPFSLKNFGNFVVNLSYNFTFYERDTVSKKYAFYAEFEEITSLTIKDKNGNENTSSNPIRLGAGGNYDLSEYIYINGQNKNMLMPHVNIKIESSASEKAYFKIGDSQSNEINSQSNPRLYLHNLVNGDDHIDLTVTMPYSINGNALEKTLYIRIEHNFKFETNLPETITASDGESLKEVYLTDTFKFTYVDSSHPSNVSYKVELTNPDDQSDQLYIGDNNVLLIGNISLTTIKLTIQVYLGSELVVTTEKSINIQPFYKLILNGAEIDGSIKLNDVLHNHTDLFNDVFELLKYSEQNNKYMPSDDFDKLIMEIDLDPNRNWDYAVKEYFYQDGEPTLLHSLMQDARIENGVLSLPEFSKTVTVPIKITMLNSDFEAIVYVEVGGIIKDGSNHGKVRDLNEYQQEFVSVIEVDESNQSKNINDYFKLILAGVTSEFPYVYLSCEIIEDEHDVITLSSNSEKVKLENGEVDVFNELEIDHILFSDTYEVKIKLTGYLMIDVTTLTYTQIPYNEIITLKLTKI